MARKIELSKMICGVAVSALVSISLFASVVECRPYYRWFDYDHFAPQAKPIQDTGAGQILGTVNPLRPYEPWVLDCNLLFHEKVETGKRHPRCKEVDDENEREYAKFLLHVQQWEEAYPDRAERWNTRFPEAKDAEKKKYEQLKAFADSHQSNLEEGPGLSPITSTQRVECTNNCKESVEAQSEQESPEANPAVDDDPQK